MRYYLFALLMGLVLLLTSCSAPKVVPKVEKEEPKVVEKQKVQVPKVVQKSDFIEENFVENDAKNRVFLGCFKTGSTILEKRCQKNINSFLKETPLRKKRNIIIEVHTDKGGTNKKNNLISKKRAFAVASSLYYKEYKYSKVYYRGLGEDKLVYDSYTPQANEANRRIVVRVREKDAVVDRKKYTKYSKKRSSIATTKGVKFPPSKNRDKIKKSVINKNPKKANNIAASNLLKYTGKADTGWLYFGKEELKEKFTISCVEDKPLKVKRKAISRSKKDEFVSGLYSKRVSGEFAKKFLEIYPIYIYENGYLPKSNPIVTLYDENKKVQRFQTTVNSYRGKKGILYRVFVNGKKSIKCLDLVIPYETKEISYGRVYTQENEVLQEYKFTPE